MRDTSSYRQCHGLNPIVLKLLEYISDSKNFMHTKKEPKERWLSDRPSRCLWKCLVATPALIWGLPTIAQRFKNADGIWTKSVSMAMEANNSNGCFNLISTKGILTSWKLDDCRSDTWFFLPHHPGSAKQVWVCESFLFSPINCAIWVRSSANLAGHEVSWELLT